MTKKKRLHRSPEQKDAILRRHHIDKVPVSTLREVDPTLPFSQNATVLRFTVAMTQAAEIETDTAENVEPQRGDLYEVVDRFAGLELALSSWCSTALLPRLAPTTTEKP